MKDLNYLAIVAAGAAGFVFAAVYYTVLAQARAEVSSVAADASRPPAWLMALEFAKAVIVAAVLAVVLALADITELTGALGLALGLWVAFPVVLLIGSVTQEGVSPKLAAIHAGDWLAKLLIIAVIVTVWR
jgi:hypothetical protein